MQTSATNYDSQVCKEPPAVDEKISFSRMVQEPTKVSSLQCQAMSKMPSKGLSENPALPRLPGSEWFEHLENRYSVLHLSEFL